MVDEPPEHDAAQHWETHASEWTRWARADRDAYWSYRDEFRAFIPAPGRSTLEIGCGEGRISRDLTSLGHRVTATDISPSLLAAATAAGSAHPYQVADATDLPFDDDQFDRVVAYNVLMDVADMPAAISEAARVLAPGAISPSPSSISSSTAARSQTTGQTPPSNPRAATSGASTSPAHAAALTHAGLAITEIREPRPAPLDDRTLPFPRWQRLPLCLWINSTPLGCPVRPRAPPAPPPRGRQSSPYFLSPEAG